MPVGVGGAPAVRADTISTSARAAVQHDALLAVEHVAVAVPLRARGDVRRGRSGRRARRARRPASASPCDDPRQRCASAAPPCPPRATNCAAQPTVGEIRLDDQALADRLHHDHHVDRAAAEAAVLGRKRQPEQPHLGQRRPRLAAPAARRGDDLRAAPRSRSRCATKRLSASASSCCSSLEIEVHASPSQAQRHLRDDVALDLVRAGVDRRLAVVAVARRQRAR